MKTISFDSAIHWQKNHKEEVKVKREELLEEVRTTCIDGLDARDINYYAAELGIDPNEVRRMMMSPDDPQEAFMAEMNSFAEDDTDAIFEYY